MRTRNDAADLPELTHQQMEFVRAIVGGKNATEAYRQAYDCSGMQPHSIWCNASKLRSDTKVAQWISAARQANLGSAILTREQHMQELERLREGARSANQHAAAITAEIARGRAAGLITDQIALTQRHDPASALAAIADHSPELAAQLAALHDIPWQHNQTKH